MEQIQYYIGIIAVIVIGIFIIKKVASCLIRTVVIFLLLGALLFLCTLGVVVVLQRRCLLT